MGVLIYITLHYNELEFTFLYSSEHLTIFISIAYLSFCQGLSVQFIFLFTYWNKYYLKISICLYLYISLWLHMVIWMTYSKTFLHFRWDIGLSYNSLKTARYIFIYSSIWVQLVVQVTIFLNIFIYLFKWGVTLHYNTNNSKY